MTYKKKLILMMLLAVGFSFVLLASPRTASASCSSEVFSMGSRIRLSVGIPFITKTEDGSNGSKCYYLSGGMKQYIAGFYTFAVSIAGFIAMVMLIVAGAQYVTAAGRADKINTAKQRIADALIGLLLLLFAVTMLQFLNPALTRLGDLGSDSETVRIQEELDGLFSEREARIRAITTTGSAKAREVRRIEAEYAADIRALEEELLR